MHKILVLAQGGTAQRIISTINRMGLESVAITQQDDAPWAAMATQTVRCTGLDEGVPTSQTIDDIIAIAQKTGTDALHPGMGALAEQTALIRTAQAVGLGLIGPPIRALRDKTTTAQIARAAGIPVIAGYHGDDQSLPRLERAARAIGYPLFIRPADSYENQGLVHVADPEDFTDCVIAVKQAGDSRNRAIILEKAFPQARLIAVHFAVDAQGNAFHLFDQERSLYPGPACLLSEAPAPNLSPELRRTLGVAAMTIAHSLGFQGVGSVDFLVDQTQEDVRQQFFFLSFVPRARLEHDVTHFLLGLDLIEWQIRIARGESLPKEWGSLQEKGTAFTAQLLCAAQQATPTAEDPVIILPNATHDKDFPGLLIEKEESPASPPDFRGKESSLARLVAHGADRMVAIDRMTKALDSCFISGVKTNRAFLAHILTRPALHERNIGATYPDTPPESFANMGVFADKVLEDIGDIPDKVIVIAALALTRPFAPDPATLYGAFADFRVNLPSGRRLSLFHNQDSIRLTIARDKIHGLSQPVTARGRWVSAYQFEVDMNGDLTRAAVFTTQDAIDVRLDGHSFRLRMRPDSA